MAFSVSHTADGQHEFTVQNVNKGVWAHASPLSAPAGYAPVMTNWDVPGGVSTTMNGDEVYLDAAYTADYTPTLLCDRRTTSTQTFIAAGQHATDGQVWYWTGAAWATLRKGLTVLGTPTWWSWVQYGSDLFLSNPYDGVYRYDGTNLIPIGGKIINNCNAVTDWTGATADATNYCLGSGSLYITTAAGTMVYNPTAVIDCLTARLLATGYSVGSAGIDYYHFKIRVSDISLIDTALTNVIFTTSGGNTLTFPASVWRTNRSGTALNVATASDNTWIDIYLLASTGTTAGTYNPASVDSITFTVDSTGAAITFNLDDFYTIYANTLPAVRYLAEYKNILFGASTLTNEDYVYFSPTQAPDYYVTTAYFPLKTRGEAITGLRNFFNQLTITAENTTHSLSGSVQGTTYPAYIFDQQLVSREHGCSSHRSIVEANNRLYWWYNGMLVEYRGTGTQKISYPIDPTLATNRTDSLPYIVGGAFRLKNQVWWTWRRDGESANDRVMRYDYIEGAFLPTEGLSTPLLHQTWVLGTERFLTVNTTTRKVLRQDSTALSFSGTAIAATLELPPFAVPKQSMEWLETYIQYLTNTGTLTVAFRSADHLRALLGESYTTLESITQSAAGELGRVQIGQPAALLQLRLTTSGVRAQVQFPLVCYARPMDERTFP